jgi:hypothetical protein
VVIKLPMIPFQLTRVSFQDHPDVMKWLARGGNWQQQQQQQQQNIHRLFVVDFSSRKSVEIPFQVPGPVKW